MKYIVATIIYLLIVTFAKATNYYVSNSGNDANNGTSTLTPWKTVSKVNNSSFYPGDSILFKKGDTWRGTLIIPSSGNASNYITFSNYGSGRLPQILGSEQATGWSNVTGNIWVSSNTLIDPALGVNHNGSVSDANGNWPGSSFFVENSGVITWGHQQKYSQAELATEYDWWWDAGHIYVYSPTNPATRYFSIEASQRPVAISTNNKEYLTIDGIGIHFVQSDGVNTPWPPSNRKGLTIRNCKISHIGIKGGSSAYGISAYYSNMLMQSNIISDCGRRAISINTSDGSGLVIKDIIIENNTMYNGYHTTGIDIAVTNITTPTLLTNVIIRNNLIYDDPNASVTSPEGFTSNLIFISNRPDSGRISNVSIYNNVFKYPSIRAIQLQGIDSTFIYNNTFYGTNNIITQYGVGIWVEGSKTNNINIKNNIFYGTANHSQNMSASAIFKLGEVSNSSVNSDYNLFYETDPAVDLIDWGTNPTRYTRSQWSTYVSEQGQDVHSVIPTDPLFVSTTDLHLQSNSPAINAGVDVGLPFNGSSPDIGAFEYGPSGGEKFLKTPSGKFLKTPGGKFIMTN